MQRTGLLLLIAAALALSSGCKSPEERLAGHAEELTEIMDEHMDSPEDAIEPLRDFLRGNLPEIAEDLVTVLVEIDGADDPKERAEEAIEALEDPLKELMKTAKKFSEKAGKSDAVAEELEDIADSYSGVGKVFMKLASKLEGNEDEGKSELVERAEQLEKEMCGCTDTKCIDAAMKSLAAFGKDSEGAKVSAREKDLIEGATKRTIDCMSKGVK